MSDMETMIPQPLVVEAGGERLEITPIRVGELPPLLAATRAFAGELLTDTPDWLAILTGHGESLLTALAIALRKERAWVDGLALDEAVALAGAVLQVNGDFFVQRVAPRLAALGTDSGTGDGPPPSNG